MRKGFLKSFALIRREIAKDRIHFLLLFFLLLAASFLRVYKLGDFLGFYFDQGRDALVVWRLLHEGKFFLIGPVTGIEGIFLGPFYYYLLTPFYLLGDGSPVFVAVALNLISVLGIFLLYLLAREFFEKKTALLAAFLIAFSYDLVIFSRWLSHPPLLPAFSLLLLLGLLKIYQGRNRWWLAVGLFFGLSLQLEAASAVFFIPSQVIFALWQRRTLADIRVLIASFFLFLATLLPQVLFNFRHDNILLAAFEKFLVGEGSFNLPVWELVKVRLGTYLDVFFSQLFYDQKTPKLLSLVFFLVLLIARYKDIGRGPRKILAIWLLTPLILYLFYQGNDGHFWGYYLAGIWSIFTILFAFFLVSFARNWVGKIFLVVFLMVFLWVNINKLLVYYRIGIGVILRDQLDALDWVYNSAGKENFNLDVYVPPVIPYAYDYLLLWYGEGKYHFRPLEKNVPLLYTLYERDEPHPERLESWLLRQGGIAQVLEAKTFGSITVEKRIRK